MSFRKAFLLSVFILSCFVALSQDRTSLSFNEPLTESLAKLEDTYKVKFYYHKDWIDSLVVNEQFENATLEEILDDIFKNTAISYYRYEDQIILSNNVLIIPYPEIINSFKGGKGDASPIEKGLVFSREYFNQSDESDLENYVFEIGNRNELVSGGTSTIAGYVRNVENGDPVEGALVYVQNPFKASTTDQNGFYSLTLPNGKNQLLVQFVGMKTTVRNVVLFANGRLDVNMAVDAIALQEVLVEADRDINVSNIQMGVNRINIEESKNVPIVLGEKDIMKVASTVAGVQTVGEGSSGFNVRGGKADQNLIMVDNAPIYNASHFFGFFSVFNSEAMESMEVFKSGIPVNYGGRLSSVFDIKSKSANKEKVAGEGGLSPITGKLTLELPIFKNKTSLLVSGRTTYSNWILRRVKNAEFNGNDVSFFDLNAKLDHVINEHNKITASAYYSRDKFQLSSDTLFTFSDFFYGNSTANIKWDHQFNPNFDMRISGIYSGYGYELSFDESDAKSFIQDFSINERSINIELNYFLGEKHTLNFGGGTKYYFINPGTKNAKSVLSVEAQEIVPEERGLESNVFFSDKFDVSDDFSLYLGLRYTIFNAFGPQKVYTYDESGPINAENVVDSAIYNSGEVFSTYHGPEFRVSGRYNLTGQSSVKFSYNRTRQYVHVLSNSASFSPTDTWRLSSPHLLPQIADQVSVGFYRNFFRNKLETSVETYYKLLDNLKDFKIGSEFLLRSNIEREILQGPGKSYGIEFSIKKKGKLNGWLNYTYARTFIKLDGQSQEEIINGGKFFRTNYDKPHTVNLVSNYKFTRRFSASLNMTYNTGRPVTVPVSYYDAFDIANIYYSDRNSYRIPDYFRVDLGINLEGNHKLEKLSHSFWSLSIYNLTGRDNPYSVFFNVEDGVARGYQLIVFGNPIPTLSYNFKF